MSYTTKKSTFDLMMSWEGGNLTYKEYLILFARLVKNGEAWTLQGMYGREASRLIEAGLINKNGTVNWKKAKLLGYLNDNIYED